MAVPSFFHYLNPLSLAAALDPEKDEEDQNSVDEKKGIATVGGTQMPVNPIQFQLPTLTMPQYIGKPQTSEAPTQQTVAAQSPQQIINSRIDPQTAAKISELNSQRAQIVNQMTNDVQGYDPTPSPLRPARDAVRDRLLSNMNTNTEASYNPTEQGFGGKLRHVGESLLLGLANAPRNRDGYVDPAVAGVAASTQALLGGSGTHQQIAREFIQPQLDAQLARRRANIAGDVSTLKEAENLYPDSAAQRMKAAQIRLNENQVELGSAQADKQSQLSVGEKEADRQEKKREADLAYRRALDVATINKVLGGKGNTTANTARGKAALNFSGDVNDAISKAGSVIQTHLETANDAMKKAESDENLLANSMMRPEDEVKVRQSIADKRAAYKSSMEAAEQRANLEAKNINSQFGGKEVVRVKKNVGPNNETTFVQLEKTKDADKIIKEHFDSMVPVPTGSGDDADSKSLEDEIIRRFKNRQ
jgi:hypothetical protein